MNNSLLIRLGLPFAAWLFVFYGSILNMVSVWGQSKTYEHSFLIVPICLWLVWQEKEKFKKEQLSIAWLPAILLLGPSILWIVGKTADIAFFEHVAAIISLQLILWAMLGNIVAKTYYFPIFYLVFCIPFGEELIPYLQSITADISVALVRFTGIPVYREGMYLMVPNGLFEVAEACSGIRFLISTIALGTLFAYMFFDKWWKKSLFIAFSCVLPIIANGLRAYGIIIIGYLSDMKYATGADHLIYGWAFFSFVTAINFGIAYLLQDSQDQQSSPAITTKGKENRWQYSGAMLWILITLISFKTWQTTIVTAEQTVVPLPVLPQKTVMTNDSTTWGISFPYAQKAVQALTSDGTTQLFSARYSLHQQDGELISYVNQLFDKEVWSVSGYKNIELDTLSKGHFPATRLDVVNLKGERMKILYWYCIDDYCSNSKLKLKLQKASRLLSGSVGYADVYALASSESSEDKLIKLATDWMAGNTERK